MSNEIVFTSEIKATLVDSMGTDLSVVNAARVSFGQRSDEMDERNRGLLGFLMRNKHSSPFEAVTAQFLIECPIFVVREVHRHRTFSYNEWSARYSVLEPKFYVPEDERPLKQVGKPGAYHFERGSPDEFTLVQEHLRHSYEVSWSRYQDMLDKGIAKEVARDLLPVGIYSTFYMTGNLRNWLNFLALRTSSDALYEIRHLAGHVEQALYKIAPTTLDLWDQSGRGSL